MPDANYGTICRMAIYGMDHMPVGNDYMAGGSMRYVLYAGWQYTVSTICRMGTGWLALVTIIVTLI